MSRKELPCPRTIQEWELRFEAGLTKLASLSRQALDDVTLEAYTEALAVRWEIEEWEAFVSDCLRTTRYGYGEFPAGQELAVDVGRWLTELAASSRAVRVALPLRTAEQRAADGAETARRFREMIASAPPPPWPTKTATPKPESFSVSVSDERLDELKRQAEQIKGGA